MTLKQDNMAIARAAKARKDLEAKVAAMGLTLAPAGMPAPPAAPASMVLPHADPVAPAVQNGGGYSLEAIVAGLAAHMGRVPAAARPARPAARKGKKAPVRKAARKLHWAHEADPESYNWKGQRYERFSIMAIDEGTRVYTHWIDPARGITAEMRWQEANDHVEALHAAGVTTAFIMEQRKTASELEQDREDRDA